MTTTTVAPAPTAPTGPTVPIASSNGPRGRSGRTAGRVLAVGAVLTATVTLVVLVPRSVGTAWAPVAAAVSGVGPIWLVVLAALWFAGLLAHTRVLTSALPGLTVRRALSLNLAGSAVSNTLPLGAPLSLGMTTAMIRSWGHDTRSTGTYLTVSSVANLVGRVVGGVLALTVLSASGAALTTGAGTAWVAGAGSVLLAVIGALLARPVAAARLGTALGRAVDAALVLRRRPPPPGRAERWAHAALEHRSAVLTVLRRSWRPMALASGTYLLLVGLLLQACVLVMGAHVALPVVLAAAGVERLVSALPLTPGGAGVAEISLVAVLVAVGMSPVAAVGAALLYRAFTFGAEIPVGFAVAAGWFVRRRHATALAHPELLSARRRRLEPGVLP